MDALQGVCDYGCSALHMARAQRLSRPEVRAWPLFHALLTACAGARAREGWRATGAHRQTSVRISCPPEILDAVQIAIHAHRSEITRRISVRQQRLTFCRPTLTPSVQPRFSLSDSHTLYSVCRKRLWEAHQKACSQAHQKARPRTHLSKRITDSLTRLR